MHSISRDLMFVSSKTVPRVLLRLGFSSSSACKFFSPSELIMLNVVLFCCWCGCRKKIGGKSKELTHQTLAASSTTGLILNQRPK